MSSRKVSSKQLREERQLNSATRVSSKGLGKRGFGDPKDGRLLFLLPILLIPQFLGALTSGTFIAPALAFLGMVGLFLGAIAVREGMRRSGTNGDSIRSLVGQPPYKTAGAVLTAIGFGAFCGVTLSYGNFAVGAIYGLLAGAACVMRYGLDSRPNKTRAAEIAELHGLDLKSVIRSLDEGEERIANIREAVEKLPGQETKRKVGRVADLAEQVLETIEHDPRDVRNARRFLISYLPDAEDVITQFANNPELLQKPELVSRFGNAIADLTKVFEEQTEKLEGDDTNDLDVTLRVLSKRLKNEGAG